MPRVGERGQVTIPKALRDKYGMTRDCDIEFLPEPDGIKLKKARRREHPVRRLVGLFGGPIDTDAHIEEHRGR